MKNGRISEISTLVAIFCHSAPNNTHKANNNLKVHALVIKQKKKIWKMSTGYSKMSFRKKLVKPQLLGFL